MLPPIKLPTKAQIIAARAAIAVNPKPKLKEWERNAMKMVNELEDHFKFASEPEPELDPTSLGHLLAFAEASEVASEPAPFIEELGDSTYCEYNQTQYKWEFRLHKGACRYQKICGYSPSELVPVEGNCDYIAKVSFDHLDLKHMSTENLEKPKDYRWGNYNTHRETFTTYVTFDRVNYEMVLVVES